MKFYHDSERLFPVLNTTATSDLLLPNDLRSSNIYRISEWKCLDRRVTHDFSYGVHIMNADRTLASHSLRSCHIGSLGKVVFTRKAEGLCRSSNRRLN